jgi:signal transduction histidine kinase
MQHSRATHIEVGLYYSEREFIVRVRDDGIGIDLDVLQSGHRAGHWGLRGMRERAESLDAKLKVWSERDAGTEVELSVPAGLAYNGAVKQRRLFGLLLLRRRK